MEAQTKAKAPNGAGERRDTAAEFVRRFEQAWSRSDPDALVALFTDEVRLVQPMAPTTVGKPAAREAFARLFQMVPDLHTVVHRWGAGEDGVVFIEFTLGGTFGGSELSWPAVDRFVLRDGLVVERASYFDGARLGLEMAKRPSGWRSMAAARMRPTLGDRQDGR
jgi:ketosteroid isomerase-like protein